MIAVGRRLSAPFLISVIAMALCLAPSRCLAHSVESHIPPGGIKPILCPAPARCRAHSVESTHPFRQPYHLPIGAMRCIAPFLYASKSPSPRPIPGLKFLDKSELMFYHNPVLLPNQRPGEANLAVFNRPSHFRSAENRPICIVRVRSSFEAAAQPPSAP